MAENKCMAISSRNHQSRFKNGFGGEVPVIRVGIAEKRFGCLHNKAMFFNRTHAIVLSQFFWRIFHAGNL